MLSYFIKHIILIDLLLSFSASEINHAMLAMPGSPILVQGEMTGPQTSSVSFLAIGVLREGQASDIKMEVVTGWYGEQGRRKVDSYSSNLESC